WLLDFLPGGVLIARRRRGIVRGHEHVQRAAVAGRSARPGFWRIFGIAQEPIRNARVSAVQVRLWAAGRWDVCREWASCWRPADCRFGDLCWRARLEQHRETKPAGGEATKHAPADGGGHEA